VSRCDGCRSRGECEEWCGKTVDEVYEEMLYWKDEAECLKEEMGFTKASCFLMEKQLDNLKWRYGELLKLGGR